MSDGGVRYATNGDIHLAFSVTGDGPKELVFVPTFFSNVDLMDAYPPIAKGFARIARFARLLRYDRRGAGASDRLCGHASLEEGVDDLLAVIEAAGMEKPTLLGINESGSLCLMAAAMQPDRFESLILYGSYASTLWQPDYPWAPRPEDRRAEVEALIASWGSEASATALNPSDEPEPELIAWAARWMRSSVSKDALPRVYELLSKTDVRGVLGSIRIPTLILHRTNDPIVSVENGRYLADKIPGARLVELPGDAHLPFLSNWDAVADEIEEYLTGVRPKPTHQRVLATILIVDIVDSTRKAAELGDDRWRQLLDRFETSAQEEVVNNDGTLVKLLGDGALATFSGPARGVRAAASLTERASSMGLELRSGVHIGEVELRQGDVAGIAVHIAHRISELAKPSEVLVSEVIPPLVAGAGIVFEDRGMHELRGIDGEWRILCATP